MDSMRVRKASVRRLLLIALLTMAPSALCQGTAYTLTALAPRTVNPTEYPNVTTTPSVGTMNISFTDSTGRAVSGAVSVAGPTTVTGAIASSNLNLTAPANFTVRNTLSGATRLAFQVSSAGASNECNGTAGSFNCSFSRLLLSSSNPPDAIVQVLIYVYTNSDFTPAYVGRVWWFFTVTPADATPAVCSVVDYDHMEVVQVVQDRNNTIPLIAGKPAVARVFLKLLDRPKPPVSGISAVLRAFRDGVELPGSPKKPFNPGLFTALNTPSREFIDNSMNFELPAEWIEAGTTDLRAEIRIPPCTGGGRPESVTGSLRAAFSSFLRTGRTTFTVGWIPFCYQPDAFPATCPNEAEIPDYDFLMRRLYPIPPDYIQYRKVPIPTPPPWASTLSGGLLGRLGESIRASNFLSALRKYKLAGESRFFDHLLGFLPQTGASLAGQADLPGEVAMIVQYDPDRGIISGIEDPLNKTNYNADTVAHEIGHNLGRHHTNKKICSATGQPTDDGDIFTQWPYSTADIQEVGFDVASRKVVPSTAGDLMSYCSNDGVQEWLSPFIYQGLMAIGLDHTAAGKPTGNDKAAGAATSQAIVSGWARKDGSAGQLDPIYQVVSADQPTPTVSDGSHCLQFSGPAGVLSKYCFQLTFIEPSFGQPADTEYFSFKIPLPAAATRLTLMAGSRELAALTAAAARPNITILAPKAGDIWTGGRRTITWTSAGGTAPLTYAVLYSADGGQAWLPLALDIHDTQYTFDAPLIDGGKNVSFRVIATSGFSSTTVDVGPIEVVQVPLLASSATTLDFSNQNVGQYADASFTISNTGTGPATLNGLSIDNDSFRLVTARAAQTIPANSQRKVTVRWFADVAGVQSGTLRITTNDPARPVMTVALRGTGISSGGGSGGGGIAGPTPAATAAGVLHAASFRGGAVAPGEIVTIFGSNIGPATLATLKLDAQGKVATDLSTARVLFDGVAAPMIYTLSGQNSAIVPYSVAGRSSTQLVVEYEGRQSAPVTLPVAAAAPGLFSANSSGTGPGAILNQNGTVNTPSNPAAAGSIVVLYGTGEGQTTPVGIDGGVANTVFPKPVLPVSVSIGGRDARVLYAGAAPNLVAGVLQVNVEVPTGLAGGNQPVLLTVGAVSSQPGLTVAIAGVPAQVPIIAVTPASLDFGNVSAGQTRDLTLSVNNNGTASLVVSALGSSNPRFSSPQGTPFTVSPGSSQNLVIRFSPGAAGTQTGIITLASNDPAASSRAISVTGNGTAATTAPAIEVTPAAVDFGTVSTGQTRDLTVVARNTGTSALIVSSISISNPRFTLIGITVPLTIAAGASQPLSFRFSPVAAGQQTGTITIASNDPARPTVIVTVTGNGSVTGGSTLPVITFGQTVNGNLTATTPGRSVDCSTCYADTYQLTVTAARTIVITLNSTAFDSYLQLLDEKGNVLASDDDGGGGVNALISGTIQPGIYRIEVTTASEFKTGPYTLAIDR